MSNFHCDLSLKLSQGEVRDFSGKVQKFSGEVQNDLREDAHLPQNPAMFSACPVWTHSEQHHKQIYLHVSA